MHGSSGHKSPTVCMHSFSFLWGPWAHLVHLLSCERLPFTLGYLATAIGTLYCALSVSYLIVNSPCSYVNTAVTQHYTDYPTGSRADNGSCLVPSQLHSWRSQWTEANGEIILSTLYLHYVISDECLFGTF